MSAEAERDRLRRLLGSAGRPRGAHASPAAPAVRAPTAAGLPAWFRERGERSRAEEPAPRASLAVGAPRGLEIARGEQGEFAARVERYPLDHRHGRAQLGEYLACDVHALAAEARDERIAAADPARAVFLDIETNGLQGGAGSYSFLIALGRFDGDAFELWQGFLRHPGDERALLGEAARRVASASFAVTFFGKSFDRHRLEDKLRLHGLGSPLLTQPHLDLYWPCRRRFRAGLPDGRLATMERAVCGVERDDDLPGSYAPAAWLDFLAGRPHRLEAVFAHNALDVLSLPVLAGAVVRSGPEVVERS